MHNLFTDYDLSISDGRKTAFLREKDIYQDGTTPFARDGEGNLWAITGHTHMGHIGVFKGRTIYDLQEVYPAQMKFHNGPAGIAFGGARYPEGALSRGSIWPFGLYICPGTGRFFCFFHNETGWAAGDTGYDSFGLCATPRYDTDFRHIGLLHSDDQGRTWDFDRWVLTAEQVCFCEDYHPSGISTPGQPHGVIRLGSGDFTLFDNPKDEYLYLIYNIGTVNQDTGLWTDCDAYIARTRKRSDGIMGDFVKWYDGAFCEAGNFGKETPIMRNIWHARAVYSESLDCFVLTGCPVDNTIDPKQPIVNETVLHTGRSLTEWSDRMTVCRNGVPFGNHYVALAPEDEGLPTVIGSSFCFLLNHNATDVIAYHAELHQK